MRRGLVISLMLACACGAHGQRHRGPTDTGMLMLMSSSAGVDVPRVGLVAEYLFDSDASDTSDNAYPSLVVSPAGVSDGVLTNASAGAGYVQLATNDTANSVFRYFHWTGIYTVSLWAKLNSLDDMIPYMFGSSAFESVTRSIAMNFDNRNSSANTNRVRFAIMKGLSGVPLVDISADNAINDTSWHHILFSGDGTNSYMYIDNVEVASAVQTVPIAGSNCTRPLYLANRNYGTPNTPFNGSLDNIRFYDVFSDATKREALYEDKPTDY